MASFQSRRDALQLIATEASIPKKTFGSFEPGFGSAISAY
jgi:hypothetical protein